VTTIAATVAGALVAATQVLAQTSDTARLDAEVLMAHALGVTRSELLLHHMRDAPPPGFDALVARRSAHEPVAYIVGHQPFWGLDLVVGPDVLIPRGDSETLIAVATERLDAHPPARVIDLGTGSGALLLAALAHWPDAQGIGIDRSPAALDIARTNAARMGLDSRAAMIAADWTQDGWANGLGRFDLVLANPPYVETGAQLDASVVAHEPHGALFAGADGLDAYRVLIPQLPGLLAAGGLALIEIGWTQADAVCALAHEAGLTPRVHADLAGRPRAVALFANIPRHDGF
jgi:release factor glutamine methyltransferase